MLGRQQRSLGVVQVGGRDDDVGGEAPLARRIGDVDADHPRPVVPDGEHGGCDGRRSHARHDLRHPRARASHSTQAMRAANPPRGYSTPSSRSRDAHQVVHARRSERRGAEEDGRVAEHLLQPAVGDEPADEHIERLEQKADEPRCAREHIAGEQGPERRERAVQEAGDGHPVGLPRAPQVADESGAPRRVRCVRTSRRSSRGRPRCRGVRRRPRRRHGNRGRAAARSSCSAAVVPSRRKKWSKTSGIRYQEGPVSKRKPSRSQDPARPPTSSRASTTVTR